MLSAWQPQLERLPTSFQLILQISLHSALLLEAAWYHPGAISFLVGIPGTFWVGIRLIIGESGGLYTIREPLPVARIEGIEGIARIECQIDSSGNITRLVPVFELDNFKPTKELEDIDEPITPVKSVQLVRLMIQEYIRHSGGEEILDDVIDDIDTYLAKHQLDDPSSK